MSPQFHHQKGVTINNLKHILPNTTRFSVIYVYEYVCTHIYIHTYIYMHISKYIHIYTHIHAFMYTHRDIIHTHAYIIFLTKIKLQHANNFEIPSKQ